MVRQVVDVRGVSDQLRAAIEIDANRKRVRLCGSVNGDASQQLSTNLEGRRSVCRGLLHVRQAQSDSSYRVEINLLPRHGTITNNHRNEDRAHWACTATGDLRVIVIQPDFACGIIPKPNWERMLKGLKKLVERT
jgi:hypothetical protein